MIPSKKNPAISVIQGDEWDFVNGRGRVGFCAFDKGTMQEAWFVGSSRAKPQFGDILLVLMKSGRVGRYRVSGLWNPRREDNSWRAHAWFQGYKEGYVVSNLKLDRGNSRLDDLLPVRLGSGLGNPLVRAASRLAVLSDKRTHIVLASPPKLDYRLPRVSFPVASQITDLQDGATVSIAQDWKVRAQFDAAHQGSSRFGRGHAL
jgi:hypothetical protein